MAAGAPAAPEVLAEPVGLECPACGFWISAVGRPGPAVRFQVTARCDCGALVSMVVGRGCGKAEVTDRRVLLTAEQASLVGRA